MKRDYIEEIKLIRSRAEFNSRYDYSSRLNDIEEILSDFINYSGAFSNELLKYIPIATIACFEAFFRSTIKEVIDFGQPFSDNVAKYNQAKNVRLDFEIVAAIQSKTLTVGDFVSHLLPYNNYEDISSNLSILLNVDFTEKLKNYGGDNEEENKAFQQIFPQIINSIKRTYELRHIFCHEFATNFNVDKAEILENYKNCKVFLKRVNDLIWDILYPDSPQTQVEMNLLAQTKFDMKERELHSLISHIKTIIRGEEFEVEKFNEEQFDDCLAKWKMYRDLHAEYKSASFKGGSMHSLIYFSDLEFVTENKINNLKEEFEFVLRNSN